MTTPHRERTGHAGIGVLDAELSARRLLSRGQAVCAVLAPAVIAVALLAHLAFGWGPAPLWWCQAAVALATAAYLVLLVFKTAVVLGAWGPRSSIWTRATCTGCPAPRCRPTPCWCRCTARPRCCRSCCSGWRASTTRPSPCRSCC
ncbi:hypothetical protein ACFQ0B_35050 [Nonomuraea thailandensis]